MDNILIIGAQKAGTTSLYDYLAGHPSLALADEKEVNYFTFKYTGNLDDYYSRFLRNPGSRYCLDASPQYLHHCSAAKRIASDLPGAHIICILRDPIDRAISNYRYNIARGLQDPRISFVEAIESAIGEETYLRKGLYQQQLQGFESFQNSGRLHVINFQDLSANPTNIVKELCRQLGIPSEFPSDNFEQVSNKTLSVSGWRAKAIFWGMSSKAQLNWIYERSPKFVRKYLSTLKRAIAAGGKPDTAGKIELSAEVTDSLTAYFADDVRALQEKLNLNFPWMVRYKK